MPSEVKRHYIIIQYSESRMNDHWFN